MQRKHLQDPRGWSDSNFDDVANFFKARNKAKEIREHFSNKNAK